MASRPRGYGLTAELQRKKEAKYDAALERQAREWIEDVTEEEIKDTFRDGLKNGVILCKLINAIEPGSVRKIHTANTAFKMMENIENFLKGCYAIGVPTLDMFQVVDLYEGQNMGQVISGIHALGRKARARGFDGPTLGVKEAKGEKRQFTQEQLRAGEGVIGLQAGYPLGANQSGMIMGLGRQNIPYDHS